MPSSQSLSWLVGDEIKLTSIKVPSHCGEVLNTSKLNLTTIVSTGYPSTPVAELPHFISISNVKWWQISTKPSDNLMMNVKPVTLWTLKQSVVYCENESNHATFRMDFLAYVCIRESHCHVVLSLLRVSTIPWEQTRVRVRARLRLSMGAPVAKWLGNFG